MNPTTHQIRLSRRRFLQWSAMSSGALALAACTTAPAPVSSPAESQAEEAAPTAEEAAVEAVAPATAQEEVEVMVGDVKEYILSSDEWEADYGQVTMQLHEARYNGETVYHIRTDASDPSFAEEVGLVYVPLLNTAAGLAENEVNTYYHFADDRPAVFSKIPGDENFTSLCRVVQVDPGGATGELDSAEAVQAAVDAGDATAEMANVFVNYPFITWPGGGLTVDTELVDVLPGGQLFAEPDTENMEVKMKLHQCYPGSRYILTDSGMMAEMMNVAGAEVTNKLKDLGGTDEIWVFGNGIPGPGVMGFQPAIFDNKAGQPAWSPFWDHRTVLWADESQARVLTNSAEIRELIESGELEEFMGVPDSHPTGFVVNCPAPILAPNDFAAEA